MVKCISAILLAAGIAFGASAQTVNEVTLVVSGDGTTKEAATHSALRSAIEQAFGTFVSANTSILNDELIKDEIVSVSSGNIQKYIELSSAILPDGNTSVTLQATVSIGKLISYTQNKGYQCEFAGQTFAMQLKLDRLNYTNAEKAIDHLIDQLKPLIPNMFDFRLKVSDPSPAPLIGENLIGTTLSVYLQQSPNVKIVFETLINTLTAIDRQSLKEGKTAYFVLPDGSIDAPDGVLSQKEHNYGKAPWSKCDRWDQFSIPANAAHKLMIFLTREITSALLNWRIKDNLGTIYEPKYSGNIYRDKRTIYTPSQKQKASALAQMPLTSDIIKKTFFSTGIKMPSCESYDYTLWHYYSSDYIVCFPYYDIKTKGIKSDELDGHYDEVASINIYIPENHIDKFSSFSIEHK